MQSLFYVEKLENTLPHAFIYFLKTRDANYGFLRFRNFNFFISILAVNFASLELFCFLYSVSTHAFLDLFTTRTAVLAKSALTITPLGVPLAEIIETITFSNHTISCSRCYALPIFCAALSFCSTTSNEYCKFGCTDNQIRKPFCLREKGTYFLCILKKNVL